MLINISKPLCFFDLETTGLNVATDKIVSIAITKLLPDGSRESKCALVNPTIPIPKEASDIHGIKDQDVSDKPTFKQLAKSMFEFVKDCDIAGYNNNGYDNALLQEEFLRCGIEFPTQDTKSIDCCFIYKHFEKRDLSSALKYYCGETMQDAHNSQADTDATVKIFFGQLEKYPELQGKTVEELSAFCNPQNTIDWQGRIIKDKDGDYVYNFGGSRGQKVKDNVGFAEWCLGKDFPESLKSLLRSILKELKQKVK